jgi:hypothetical protein
VRRAHALPLYHPQFPGVEVPGVVTVIVVPEVDETVNWPPMHSESTLKAFCSYLNQRRLLTTEGHLENSVLALGKPEHTKPHRVGFAPFFE